MSTPSYFCDGVPVFTPSIEEFSDFYGYMKAINSYGMAAGIVKVIPPAEWVEALPEISEEKLRSIKIKNPIIQHFNGSNGVFASQNIERPRTYNIVQWKALSEASSNQPPAPRGKLRKAVDGETQRWNSKVINGKVDEDSMFESFEYNIDVSEFTPERCEQLERVYWKSLIFADPMYGADMLGSIFDDSVKHWNVARLPNVLDHLEEKLPGVNDAYLYAGLWKASFSWHLEDQDLYSINYLHFGAPKQWYSIPRVYKDKFDVLMRELFPEDSSRCPDFLRHKTFLASPSFLESKGIKVNKIVHHQGEFMITYPYGYHAGMNYGYNLAESVNFATDDWFEYGLKTTKCLCISDSVGIDVPKLIRRFKGEAEPEIESECDHVVESDETPITSEDEHVPTPVIKLVTPSTADSKSKASNDALAVKTKRKRKASTSSSSSPVVLKRRSTQVLQCQLCPHTLPQSSIEDNSMFTLVPIVESLENGDAETIQFCHAICAYLLPETSIQVDGSNQVVLGMSEVSNARRSLKCLYCHSKKGVCFQCTSPKCTRSYHGTCAVACGVELHAHDSNHLCRFHRDRSPMDINSRFVDELEIGDIVQVKLQSYFPGKVVSKNLGEGSISVKAYPMKDDDDTIIEVPISRVAYQGIKNSLFKC